MFCALLTLSMRGTFTSKAAEAQNFFCIGLPVWFIRPLTAILCIHSIVMPTPITSIMEVAKMRPALFSGPGNMAGVVQKPGVWPYEMQEATEAVLLAARLPPLVKENSSHKDSSGLMGEPTAKKQCTDATSTDHGICAKSGSLSSHKP